MSFWERFDSALTWLITSVITAMASGVLWLVRRVLTNQRQIALLQAEIKHRDQLRQEDREDMTEVKASVKRIENRLLGVRCDE